MHRGFRQCGEGPGQRRARPAGVAATACSRLEVMQIPSAGAVVFDGAGRILLIRRGKPPQAGRWSVPGGKCRPDESTEAACVREVWEETGIRVRVIRPAGRVTRPAPDGNEFLIDDFVCAVQGQVREPVAADDAADAGWFTMAELTELRLVTGLIEALIDWQLVPPPTGSGWASENGTDRSR